MGDVRHQVEGRPIFQSSSFDIDVVGCWTADWLATVTGNL